MAGEGLNRVRDACTLDLKQAEQGVCPTMGSKVVARRTTMALVMEEEGDTGHRGQVSGWHPIRH